MARYVEKTETEVAWNRIRREVQFRAHCAASQWREEKLNEILPRLQEQFDLALNKGTVLALEAKNVAWVTDILDDDPV